ncbi:MAG: GYD domain-containing protein [Gemmatimonadetes bacterium]|nr:GYD domain-containing protein [Gemmatimonadota bacterium]
MPTYVLLSKLTGEGAETLTKNPGRIRQVNSEIEKFGVKVREQFAVLGPFDFVNIVDAPDNATIARVSAELGARGSVQITTLAAVPLDDFVALLERKA